MKRVENEARRYKVQVRYIRPSTRIRDIFQAPILLHRSIRITVLMKKLPIARMQLPLFSFCPSFMKYIHRAILGFMIAGFSLELDENCTLRGHYAASSGNSVPTFRDNQSVPSSRVESLTLEDGVPQVVPKRR